MRLRYMAAGIGDGKVGPEGCCEHLVLGDVLAGQVEDDLAVAQDDDPVGDLEQLLEIAADGDDCSAGSG